MTLLGDSLDIGGERDHIACLQPLGIAHEGDPATQVMALVQRRTDLRLTARPFQLRRDYTGVVEHQHIAGAQNIGQVVHVTIGERLAVLRHEETRCVARACRAQGDEVGGKVEVEQVYAHDSALEQPGAPGKGTPIHSGQFDLDLLRSAAEIEPGAGTAEGVAVGVGATTGGALLSDASEACRILVGSLGGSPR